MPLESNDTLRDIVNMVVEEIRKKKPDLDIDLKDTARGGAQISAHFESEMEVLINSDKVNELTKAKKGPGTKSPFDIEFYFREGKIWVDFKTWKQKANGDWPNSNPDMGTYKKIKKLTEKGVSHFLFVHLFYKKNDNGRVSLIDTPIHCPHPVFFIQEIPKRFNVSSNNQMHYNNRILNTVLIGRTWDAFLALLKPKLKLAFEEDKRKAQEKLDTLDSFIDDLTE